MSIQEKVIFSKERSDKHQAFEALLQQGGCRDLYEAVLNAVPKTLSSLDSFVKVAIENLSKIESSVSHAKTSSVTSMLSHLTEVGMVKTKQTICFRVGDDGNTTYTTSSNIQYCLA